MTSAGHASTHERENKYIDILNGKSQGNKQFGLPFSCSNINTDMDLNQSMFQIVKWIHVARDKRQ